MKLPMERPWVGFVVGDHAGIGPEIVLKLLKRPSVYDLCHPIIIGNAELLDRKAKQLGLDFLFVPYTPEALRNTTPYALGRTGIPVADIAGSVDEVVTGMVNTAAGWITYHSIVAAYGLLEQGFIEGVVMAPVTKESLSKCGCGYHSEYEILAHCAGTKEAQTVVKGGGVLRASVVGHIPFRQIIATLTEEKVYETGQNLIDMIHLVYDQEPRLLVAGLNPCVEDGIMGEEEHHIIMPALERLRRETGVCIEGPLPAEDLLNKAVAEGYNGILYLYHDQGNIAMKTQMFQTTACIYTHVPYPIASTGHGSALDIADLGIANPTNITYVLNALTDIIETKRKMNSAKLAQ